MPANLSTDVSSPQIPADCPRDGKIDPANVRAQLERIVASAPFRNSKRYPALLRYVVERSLDGASAELKERTIGIDVFGREPTYDLNADPVVRISAGEVRKRLAQYYQGTGQHYEVRIELPVGSYQPEFLGPLVLPTPAEIVPLPASQGPLDVREIHRGRRTAQVSGLAAIIAILILAIFWFTSRPSALDLFWHPVVIRGKPITLCVARGVPMAKDGSTWTPLPLNGIAWPDAETLARLAGLVAAKGGDLRILREDLATFSDFQQNPSVLIGAYNDQWTLDLMQKMRYTFQSSGDVRWIADRDRPSFRDWSVNLAQRNSYGGVEVKQDYAIISRVQNPRTGFITVTVAGVAGSGTIAAGLFLTDPKYLQEALAHAPRGWGDRDMQIVIGTEVDRGSSGPPRVLAIASW